MSAQLKKYIVYMYIDMGFVKYITHNRDTRLNLNLNFIFIIINEPVMKFSNKKWTHS